MAKKTNDIDALLAQIRKNNGEDSIMRLDGPPQRVDVIPTGCLSLDVALGIGGYPRGRIIEIYGPESAGKSTLTLHAIVEVQKLGGLAAFIDAEHALDPIYAQKLGVDTSKVLISQPSSGEQALKIAEELVDSKMVDLIVIDSVAALTPQAELDGDIGDSHVGLHARLMGQAMRMLAGKVSKNAATLIFINQLRLKIGVLYGSPETTTGGQALKFYSSVRIDVRKREKTKDKDGEDDGNRTVFKVVKNKLAVPFREADVEIKWGVGIDRTGDILTCAVNRGLVEKAGNWYSYGGVKLGMGFNTVAEKLRGDPKLLGDIEQRVRKELLP